MTKVIQKISEKIKTKRMYRDKVNIITHTKSMTFYECNAVKKSTFLQLVFKTE